MTNSTPQAQQLGFDTLLADAETENQAQNFARQTAHLPGTLDDGIPFFRRLIEQNHAAMLAADVEETRRLHGEARLLALKLNNGDGGILAHDDAPGYVLARETAAKQGEAPHWGQTGEFTINAAGMDVRIDMQGMYGIGSGWGFWPGFAVHAVNLDKAFLSETGYRSFLGIHADPRPGMTSDSFAAMIINAYVANECKGRLSSIQPRYRRSTETNT